MKKKGNKSKLKRNQPLSLKNNSIWNLLGSVIHSLTQWGILISIAKLGSPEMVGVFTLALAITSPIVLLFRFKLRQVVVSDSFNDFSFNQYYTLRILSTFIFIIVMFIIAMLYSPEWEIVFVVIMLSLARAIESISDVLFGQMQKNERMDYTAKSVILKGIISLIIFTIVMFTTANLILSTSAYFISWLLILIIYDYPRARIFSHFKLEFKVKKLKSLFWLSIPLGIAQLIGSLNVNVPRYILEYYYDPILLGFFGAIIYIISAGNNLVLAISASIMPRLSKYYHNNKIKKYLKLFINFLLLIISGSLFSMILVYFWGEEILTILYSSEYGKYSQEFLMFLFYGLIMYSSQVIGVALTSMRTFKIQTYIKLFSLIIIIIMSYLLIPDYGMVGVFFSLLLGQFVQLTIRLVTLIVILKKQIQFHNLKY